MKNVTRKLLIPGLTLSLLSSGAVFAEELVNTPAVTEAPTAEVEIETAPVINGASINGVEIATLNDVPMFPLRQVAEALGYNVAWQETDQSVTLTKGAQFIQIRIGEDSYSFSRRAPQTLGSAPVLKNDTTTYVPLAFISEILGGYSTTNEDGTYKIVLPSIVNVTAVNEDGSFLVADSYLGEVLVLTDENTRFEGGTTTDIKVDTVLGIEYNDAMTASIPPQTTAIAIRFENAVTEVAPEEAETETTDFTFAGTITAIEGDLVYVGEPEAAGSICLVVGEDTRIQHVKNRRLYRAEDLEVGMEISGTHAEAMTMSIPPQTAALTIQIQN